MFSFQYQKDWQKIYPIQKIFFFYFLLHDLTFFHLESSMIFAQEFLTFSKQWLPVGKETKCSKNAKNDWKKSKTHRKREKTTKNIFWKLLHCSNIRFPSIWEQTKSKKISERLIFRTQIQRNVQNTEIYEHSFYI